MAGPADSGGGRISRLVLADDHEDFLSATQVLLAAEFAVVRLVADGTDLVAAVAEELPDIVVTDITMPGLSGIEAGRRVLRAGYCQAVVLLTMHNEPVLVRQALESGIHGYVLKTDAGEELIPALYAVLEGVPYLSRRVRNPRSL